MNLSILIDSTLYSYSQIFFSNRRWFGALILIATFLLPFNGAVIIFSTLFSNLIAILFNYNEKRIREGFYGFNGLLFGAGLAFFFKPNEFFLPVLLVFLFLAFFITSSIENYFAVGFNLPGLSLPFLITFLSFVLFNNSTNLFEIQQYSFVVKNYLNFLPDQINFFFQNLSLLVLLNNVISGVIIFIAILLFSRVMAILSVFGYLFALLTIQIFNITLAYEITLLFILNSIITSIALGGSLILPSNKSLLISALGVILVFIVTLTLNSIFSKLGLSVLVLPFNIVVLTLIYSLKFRDFAGEVVLLYFKPGSPEENYYYHRNRISRFERYKLLNVSLPFNGEWVVTQGIEGEYTHKEDWKYAFDFEVFDEENNKFTGSGNKVEDYHCYNLPVIAPYKGKVVRVIDSVDDNPIGQVNIKQNWGNSIVIDHGDGLFSALSHLRKGSIKVKEGDIVLKGDVIGYCGNSGRSSTPHLHFQFQKNDKIGGSTLKFPFGHYLRRIENTLVLHTADFPAKDDRVQNIEINRELKDAFNFEYGDSFKVSFNYNDLIKTETWEILVDPYNVPYIQSSSGSIANFFNDGEVFYFTSYIGKKRDALYHFYLASIQVPFVRQKNVLWEDEYQISLVAGKLVMILSDFLILISNPFKAKGTFNLEESSDGSSIIIKNKITFYGKGLFNFVRDTHNYETVITSDGKLKSYSYYLENKKIEFRFILEE